MYLCFGRPELVANVAGQIQNNRISPFFWAAMAHLLPNKHQLIASQLVSWLCNDVQCRLPCPGGLPTWCSIPIWRMARHQPSKLVKKIVQHDSTWFNMAFFLGKVNLGLAKSSQVNPLFDVTGDGVQSWPSVVCFFPCGPWHSVGLVMLKSQFTWFNQHIRWIHLHLWYLYVPLWSFMYLWYRANFGWNPKRILLDGGPKWSCFDPSFGESTPRCPWQVRCHRPRGRRERPTQCPMAHRLVMTCHGQLVPKKSHPKKICFVPISLSSSIAAQKWKVMQASAGPAWLNSTWQEGWFCKNDWSTSKL